MEYQKASPEKKKEADKKWRETHQGYIKEARMKWGKTEKCKEGKRRWRKNNPEKYLVAINKAAKVRLSTPKGRLNLRISTAIRSSLKRKGGAKYNRHWESLVDFTIDQLKIHLEKKFTPDMSWDNYGTYWHIDHKMPVAIFNFNHPEDIDFRICWSIKNLQPMEAKANQSKGAKVDDPFQPSLTIGRVTK
jgi:hypothetical protein